MVSEGMFMTMSFATLNTFIWFFSSVSSLMYNQVGLLAKSYPTLITFIWFLPGMSSLMVNESLFMAEDLPTVIAFIRLPRSWSFLRLGRWTTARWLLSLSSLDLVFFTVWWATMAHFLTSLASGISVTFTRWLFVEDFLTFLSGWNFIFCCISYGVAEWFRVFFSCIRFLFCGVFNLIR